MPKATDARAGLHRRLNLELECRVEVAANSSWTTSSSLPHAIRLHVEAGVELVRVSADMVVRARPTRDLLQELNRLNSERAFTRRIVDEDGTVTIVAEMPLASLRKGDLEQLVSMVHCLARLDAPLLADHGGLSVTDPSVAPALDLDRPVDNWQDLLQASGTATTKELQVWLDQWADGDCSIERDDESVTVWVDTNGRTTYYPFSLTVLRDDVKFLQQEEEEQEELEQWSPPDPVQCPRCRRMAGVVIVYGMPSGALFEAAEKNQLALGGCVIFEDQPEYRCRECGHQW